MKPFFYLIGRVVVDPLRWSKEGFDDARLLTYHIIIITETENNDKTINIKVTNIDLVLKCREKNAKMIYTSKVM